MIEPARFFKKVLWMAFIIENWFQIHVYNFVKIFFDMRISKLSLVIQHY
jgi:hypothetical protein